MSAPPFVTAQIVPLSLPVMQLVDFSMPWVTASLQHAVECVNTHTKQFILLSPFAFLCIIPQNSFRRSSSGRLIELCPGPFWDTFHALMAEKEAILTAVRVLLKPSCQNQVETNTGDENGDY
jgi:hypothetical protein